MNYLFLLIILALAISPIVAMRASPRQKRVAMLRRKATSLGLVVKLSRRPDARDDEKDLDSVMYLLPWGGATPEELRPWTIVSGSARGGESDWPNWRWFVGPAPSGQHQLLGELLVKLPEAVTGLVVDRLGVAVHWQEYGDEQTVDILADVLQKVRSLYLDKSKILQGK